MDALRRSPRAALALAGALALSACNKQDVDNFFLVLLMILYGGVAGLTSLFGIGFALVHTAQRRPRSLVNVLFAVPFAAASIVLHGAATFGFDHTFDRGIGKLMALVGMPILWLALAFVQAALAQPRQPMHRPAPRAEDELPLDPPLSRSARGLIVVGGTVLALVLYTIVVVRALRVPY
jgi:hypothetical protein